MYVWSGPRNTALILLAFGCSYSQAQNADSGVRQPTTVAPAGQVSAFPGADRLIWEIRSLESGTENDELALLAKAAFLAGDRPMARRVFEKAITSAGNTEELLEIASLQIELGERNDALVTIRRTHRKISGTMPKTRETAQDEACLGKLASSIGFTKDAGVYFDAAREIVKQLARSERTLAVDSITREQLSVCDAAGALQTLKLLDDETERTVRMSMWNIDTTCNDVALLRCIREALGSRPINGLDEGNLDLLYNQKVTILAALAPLEYVRGDERVGLDLLKEAHTWAKKIVSESDRRICLGAIIRAYIQVTHDPEAISLVESFNSKSPMSTSYLLSSTGAAFQERGSLDQAICYFKKGLEIAEDDTTRHDTLLKLAQCYVALNNRTLARDFVTHATQLTGQLNPNDPLSAPLAFSGGQARENAFGFALIGDFAAAIRTAKVIRHSQIRGDALAFIAELQARSHDAPGALQTLDLIPFDRDPADVPISHQRGWADAVEAIAAIQAESGDLKGALVTANLMEDDGKLKAFTKVTEGLNRHILRKAHPVK